jgi:deoxyribodipyrimidine photo-lyase
MTTPPPTILWFRRDLRLHDHAALAAAIATSAPILPLFILDTTQPLGGAAAWWLHHSLASLAQSLEALGAPLILRRGDPTAIVPALAHQLNATQIHAGIAHEPATRQADATIAQTLAKSGRTLTLHHTATLSNPDTIRTQTNTIYGMYTPYARALEAQGEPPPPIPAPTHLHAAGPIASDRLETWNLLPTKPDWAAGLRATWSPGEPTARARLKSFAKSTAAAYDTGRNLPGQEGTSRLSPHLHFGEISPASAWRASRTKPDNAGHQTWRRELIWRDFAAYQLWHHTDLAEKPLRPAFDRLEWREDKAALHAWQRGQTGVPIVDAGMRQLWQTGWMHNRVRMIAASYLVKHLLIAWQHGAAWFMDTLVDADLASNSTNWQWVAGTGIDSQPFFRIFNPTTQGEKFDPDGAYTRHYVPELAKIPNKYLHAPWSAPPLVLQAAGIRLGHTYPTPRIDLAAGRDRALAIYRRTVREAAA